MVVNVFTERHVICGVDARTRTRITLWIWYLGQRGQERPSRVWEGRC